MVKSGEVKRTMVAQKAFEITDQLKLVFGKRRYGSPALKFSVLAPDGPSTSGGKLARQTLSLVSEEGKEPIGIGWINVAEKRAAFRPAKSVAAAYKSRYKKNFPVALFDLDTLGEDIAKVLNVQQFEVTHEEAKVAAVANNGSSNSSRTAMIIGVAAAVVLILGAIAFVSFR